MNSCEQIPEEILGGNPRRPEQVRPFDNAGKRARGAEAGIILFYRPGFSGAGFVFGFSEGLIREKTFRV